MTDPTGLSFLSYRRTRSKEAQLLVGAQNDLGIPTWHDLGNLGEGPTEAQLRAALDDPVIANGVLWLTPDVADSDVIRRVEIPALIRRVDARDAFFVVPVAAGGLGYAEAAEVAQVSGIHDLANWNLSKVDADPIAAGDANQVALRVLYARLAAIHRTLPASQSLSILYHTRARAPFAPGNTLVVDWTRRFHEREASSETWDQLLLPALSAIVNAIGVHAPGRSVSASGLASLPAGLALGSAFLAPRGIHLEWSQRMPSGEFQTWSLNAQPEPSGFRSEIIWGSASGTDLAVLVSVAEDAASAFGASRGALPNFRAILRVSKEGPLPHMIASPGQAVDLVDTTVEAMREMRRQSGANGDTHLFLASPLGIAVLLGQRLNTLGPIQCYEHIPSGAVGLYRRAVKLSVGV